jgi:hypothetical protein
MKENIIPHEYKIFVENRRQLNAHNTLLLC